MSEVVFQGDYKSQFGPLPQIICLGGSVRKQPGSRGAVIQSKNHSLLMVIGELVKSERFICELTCISWNAVFKDGRWPLWWLERF